MTGLEVIVEPGGETMDKEEWKGCDTGSLADRGGATAPPDTPPPSEGVDRRGALARLLNLLVLAVSSGGLPLAAAGAASGAAMNHALSEPRLKATPVAGDFLFFSAEQKATVSALAELIIPADTVAPGAQAAKVPEYLDFVLASATPEEQRAWTDGLRVLDELSAERGGKSFAALSAEQQRALLADLVAHEFSPNSPAARFFVRLKHSVAEGFYTSRVGLLEDLKYKGGTVALGPATCKDHFGDAQVAVPSSSTALPPAGDDPAQAEESWSRLAPGVKLVAASFGPEAPARPERDLPAICSEEYDVCIVGSGAAGGIAAKELTEKGLRVVLLEAGNWVSTSRFRTHVLPFEMPFRGRWLSHGENDYTGFLYAKDPVTCPKERIDYALLPAVGGKTLTWAAISWRFGERDFQNRGIGDDWPFGYRELEPYYSRAELFMGVSGSREGLASVPDGHFLKPLTLRCGEQLIKEACERKLGPAYRIIPLRKAINTEPHGGRPTCHYCGYCMRGCHVSALYSSANSAVPAAMRTGRLTLVTDAIVREIELDSSGQRCHGAVFIDRQTRKEFRVRARVFALACGGVEDVRILLMSKSKLFPQGLANSSGYVGKNLVSEHYSGCMGYLERLLGAKVLNEDGAGEHGEIQNVYYEKPSKQFARGYMIDIQSGPDQVPSFAALVPGFGAKYREEVRRTYPALVHLGAHGEMLANEKSYVDLDPVARDGFGLPKARMHLEWSENELAMVRDASEKCRAIIEAAGGKVLFTRAPDGKPHFDGENLVGTVRMGNDPRRSVLNSRNQAHDVKNLWVLDGASFTSYCEKNPTLTVVAVAIRAADHLAEALRRGEV
jgi:choline dehydrogenase-like flavoprotein